MKRILSLLLSAALVLCLLPGAAWAAVPSEVSSVCTPEEWEMLILTNQERLNQGLSPYSLFPRLQNAAETRKEELVTSYSHTRPDGRECLSVLTEQALGYTSAGENIASGQLSPADVLRSWLESPAHRSNILSDAFAHMGCGYTQEGFLGSSWVQLFLNKGCSVSEISLSQSSVSCAEGSSLQSLELYVEAACPFHGTCYLPLLDGMCTGYDSSLPVTQLVTVSYGGRTAQLEVRVTAAPLNTTGASPWAVEWLNQANELGLLSQSNRSGFTRHITRMQFADIAVRLAEALTGETITPAPDGTFPDTADETARKAAAAGLVSGYPDGSFQPGVLITRQELCVLMAHVVEYVENHRGTPSGLERSAGISDSFPDRALVVDWAIPGVAMMTGNGLVAGRDGRIDPIAYTHVQEAATLAVKLYRVLEAQQ